MASLLSGPGCPERSMGIGALGSDNITFKRKFRWTFQVERSCNGQSQNIPPYFVKVASRPNISFEETEINYLNEKTWIPGKATWETITVTYIDVGVANGTLGSDGPSALYSWLASVYDFTSTCRWQGSRVSDYAAKAILRLYDGCGQVMEEWTLENVWPQSINFGDLDMSSSDTVDIELTLRYSKVTYTSVCPLVTITTCCTPCNSGGGETAIFS